MKKNKFFALFLILLIALFPLRAHAGTLTLDRMLDNLTKPRLTSLQKSNLIEEYKGQDVKGTGIVTDVLKGYGAEDEAMVYLKKSFRGKEYEVVLTVSRESVEKIQKKKTVKFEGAFDGMTFKTLRFKGAKIIRKGWWPF